MVVKDSFLTSAAGRKIRLDNDSGRCDVGIYVRRGVNRVITRSLCRPVLSLYLM